MSDQQVAAFIASEVKAGTSQAQIVTKLMQKGVKIDQIRRLRNQYDKQISGAGKSAAADGAVAMAAKRMQGNSDGTTAQELTTARVGTTGTIETDAAADVQDVENDVKATQGIAPDANGKKVYGRDIFRQANPNFQPNANMPIPDSYVLGPGDQVVVDIYGASQGTLVHTISPEGTITVAGYGPIYLSGLSVTGAQKKLRSTLGSRYKSSDLKLTVGNTRTIQVNIMGEVRTPGTYHLSAFANVFYALYRAGGTNDLGTLRNIKVYRNGRLVTVVDLYQYILNGRLAGNIRLQDNDVIQVEPYESLVGITGNVKRPMFYEMRKNESVATLLKYAGGFTGDAHKKSVRLVRQTGERYQVYNVNEFDMATFKLADGDAITVDGILNRFENMVEIKGAVFRPGQFHLGEGVTSVRSLVQAAEGLTEDAYTGRAVLHRLKADRTLETQSLDLAGIMAGTAPDVPLRNEDVLFIMTQEDLRQERTFTITGEVMSPGTYEYSDNTTIQDLIVMAGGLRDQASLAKVEVSRRILDPNATQKSNVIAQTFSFDLKDGLVLNGNSGFVLEPYDVVHIYRSPAFSTARNCRVFSTARACKTPVGSRLRIRLRSKLQRDRSPILGIRLNCRNFLRPGSHLRITSTLRPASNRRTSPLRISCSLRISPFPRGSVGLDLAGIHSGVRIHLRRGSRAHRAADDCALLTCDALFVSPAAPFCGQAGKRDLLKRERFVKHCLKIRHQVSCVFFYQDLLHVQERLAKDLRRDQRLLFLPAFRQFRSTRISSGPFQIRDQLLQRLITILLGDGHAFTDHLADRDRALRDKEMNRPQRIGDQTVHRLIRHLPRDAAVQRGAESVDIRPRPLDPLAAVLLLRRVPRLQNHRQTLRVIVRCLPGRAEVQDADLAALGQHDIVRADIAVDDPGFMDVFQRDHSRHQKIQRLFPVHGAVFVQPVLQGPAVQILHDDICRLVFLEIILDADDAVFLAEFREHHGLAVKLLAVFPERLRLFPNAGDDVKRHCSIPVDETGHIVFLDRHTCIQDLVPALVGDSETAFSNDPPDLKPAVQYCSRRQLMRLSDVFFCHDCPCAF